MKLYRGYRTKPIFPTPELAKEFVAFTDKKDSTDELKDGPYYFARRAELGKIFGPQYFTDQELIARRFALKDQCFIVAIDVNNEVAQSHYDGEVPFAAYEEINSGIASIFVFTGEELAQNRHEWKLESTEFGPKTVEGNNIPKEIKE